MKKIFLSLFVIIANIINAQDAEISWETYIEDTPGKRYYMPPPDNYRDVSTADITVYFLDYPGNDTVYSWTEDAKTAYNYAVSIWESILISEGPIEINAFYRPLGFDAGGTGYYALSNNFNWEGAIENTYYPYALANSFDGVDVSPNIREILNQFNSNVNWYFGLDGNCPINKYDFVNVAIHEIGHGLGFNSSFLKYASYATYGLCIDGECYPNIFDHYIWKESEDMYLSDITLPLDSAGEQQLMQFVYSGDKPVWHGIFTPTAHLYNPSSWALSHLSDAFYNPHFIDDTLYTINSVLTAHIYPGQSNHNPEPLTIGILKDMGWEVDYNWPPTMLEFDLTYNGPVGSLCSSVILDFEANLADEYKISYFKLGSKEDTILTNLDNDIFDIQIDDLKVDESYAFWFEASNEYAKTTSDVIVRGACRSPIVVYPNPTVESVKVEYEEDDKIIENVEVRKTDNPNIGKTKQGDGVSNEISVNIDDLPVGTYTVIVTNADGTISTKTIVVY